LKNLEIEQNSTQDLGARTSLIFKVITLKSSEAVKTLALFSWALLVLNKSTYFLCNPARDAYLEGN
jgi:hypothetical protein